MYISIPALIVGLAFGFIFRSIVAIHRKHADKPLSPGDVWYRKS